MNVFIIAVGIFVVSYIAIISEKFNRMVIALMGGLLMVLFQVINQEEALGSVDFNTLGLLIGMMIIVGIIKRTGLFQYIAIRSAKVAKGEPWPIALLFAVITMVASALLDNVTTVLLLAPVTFVITETLEVNPIPFMIPMIFASNIGGTATIIGDATTIMVGSATHFSFVEFSQNMIPVAVIAIITVLTYFSFIYKGKIKVSDHAKMMVFKLDESRAISDKPLMYKSIAVLGLVIFGFIMHQALSIETATVALFGATLLLLISDIDPEELLMEIEWNTIFFFIGLFILVGALEKVGLIEMLAQNIITLTGGNLYLTSILILWVSAILSAFLDNVPFVTAMIPLIKSMSLIGGMNSPVLWYVLVAGACMGGNGTLIGASCNVIIGGMLNKRGNKIDFMAYFKVAFPGMLLIMLVLTGYFTVFYF